MKKTRVTPLRLNRETIRTLDLDELRRAEGGVPILDTFTYHNSCDVATRSLPRSVCNSCFIC